MSEAAFHALQLLYFFLPAYLANMAPPFTRYWSGWNPPLHRRLFGSHKTVLGFALGVAAALATTAAQALLLPWLPDRFVLIDYGGWPWWGLGFGFGALGGDALKSLCKRRLGLAPGQSWPPFDQVDFVFGALLLVGPAARLSLADAVFLLAFSFVADLAVNRLAFRLGLKDVPW